MIPLEIQLHICYFLNQKTLKEMIILSCLKKKPFLKKGLILIYEKNLKTSSYLLHLTFTVFKRISTIQTFDKYINFKSEIFLNYNDSSLKNKFLAYYFFKKLQNTIKNNKNRNKFTNICKQLLIANQEYIFPEKINTVNYY
jgi:hypothetical protein